ncbi:MAG: extracellular solute-binding protein [Candidatus Pacebacteria bacterium]|nr:extracellular solute-binding protein [Candidatus Paceibacterota bacterium]
MKEILTIKNIIIALFALFAIVAFLIFSGFIKVGKSAQQARGSVVVWGTIPFSVMQPYIDKIQDTHLTVTYSEKKEATYESELINAFASGTGPDLFIMSHEAILRNSDKVFEVPYTSFRKDIYENSYISEARLFLTETGILAFPLFVDPLVMYYNKPLIASYSPTFSLRLPQYWSEFQEFAREVTQYNETGEVIISAVGLGTFDNILHAKDILATLFIQNGNQIVGTNTTTGKKQSVLTFNETALGQSEEIVNFYTSFSRFGSTNYSWNEALLDTQNSFISGNLAVYFGLGSEAGDIRMKNPNLDFGVMRFPQKCDPFTSGCNNSSAYTFGAMTGIAVSKHSKNLPAALAVASKVAGGDIVKGLATDFQVAPARKDILSSLLQERAGDPLNILRYESAVIATGWFDPDNRETENIFSSLIRNVNSLALSSRQALAQTQAALNLLLDRTINLRA